MEPCSTFSFKKKKKTYFIINASSDCNIRCGIKRLYLITFPLSDQYGYVTVGFTNMFLFRCHSVHSKYITVLPRQLYVQLSVTAVCAAALIQLIIHRTGFYKMDCTYTCSDCEARSVSLSQRCYTNM